MPRLLNVAIAAVILLALLGYMVTYTVRFNQTAIVTYFGSAGDASSVINAPGPDGRPGEQAGLHFKAPWPIQQVARVYDTRVQILETKLEQAGTSDTQTVDLQLFLTWRISDPLAFYKKLGSNQEAVSTLQARARASISVIGNYAFDQLTNVDPQKLKLGEAEAGIKRSIQDRLDEIGYGITVGEVGIKRILLSGTVNSAVIARMQAERQRYASAARAEGQTESETLRATANTQAGIIASFADLRARQIEAEGRQRSAEYITRFAQDQDFAIYLAQLDALRQSLSQRTRFILDTTKPPFNLLDGLLGSETSQTAPATRPTADAGASISPPPDLDR